MLFRSVHRPITIGHGVWIGARAIVLGGVTVGEESVVGAGAVVTRDVPARSVVTGAPVRHRPIAFSPSHAQTYTRLT